MIGRDLSKSFLSHISTLFYYFYESCLVLFNFNFVLMLCFTSRALIKQVCHDKNLKKSNTLFNPFQEYSSHNSINNSLMTDLIVEKN